MKIVIVVLFLIPNFLFSQKKAGYINSFAHIGLSYQWNEFRKGINFSSKFVVTKNPKLPLYIGFDAGWNSLSYHGQLPYAEVNAYAKSKMDGDQLVSAEITSTNSSGISGGLNITQFFFLNNTTIPGIGIGLKATRFPKDEVSIYFSSKDATYMYSDTDYLTIDPAFWNVGLFFYADLGMSAWGFMYGFYPRKERNIHTIGFYYILGDGVRTSK